MKDGYFTLAMRVIKLMINMSHVRKSMMVSFEGLITVATNEGQKKEKKSNYFDIEKRCNRILQYYTEFF